MWTTLSRQYFQHSQENNHHHTSISNLNEEIKAEYKDEVAIVEINTDALVIYLAVNFEFHCRASPPPFMPESL